MSSIVLILAISLSFYSSASMATTTCKMRMLELVQKDFNSNWQNNQVANNIMLLEDVSFGEKETSVSYKGKNDIVGLRKTCWVTYYMNEAPPTKGGCPFDAIAETKVFCK